MKLLLWHRMKSGKWLHLTHFPDGKIGLTMQRAMTEGLNRGFGRGMGELDHIMFTYEPNTDRFVLWGQPGEEE